MSRVCCFSGCHHRKCVVLWLTEEVLIALRRSYLTNNIYAFTKLCEIERIDSAVA